jgi:hypothetical protein
MGRLALGCLRPVAVMICAMFYHWNDAASFVLVYKQSEQILLCNTNVRFVLQFSLLTIMDGVILCLLIAKRICVGRIYGTVC